MRSGILRLGGRSIISSQAGGKQHSIALTIYFDHSKMKKPIRITRFGKPVAEVVPPSPGKERGNWLGSMKGRGEILGDIISPATDPEDWEVLRD
jgi:hypothetical protein